MNADELLVFHSDTCDAARKLMERKNHDYTNGQTARGGPFANFQLAESLGLCHTEVGMAVRLSDKMARMATLLTREAKVADESLLDTALDIINYTILIAALRKSKGGA